MASTRSRIRPVLKIQGDRASTRDRHLVNRRARTKQNDTAGTPRPSSDSFNRPWTFCQHQWRSTGNIGLHQLPILSSESNSAAVGRPEDIRSALHSRHPEHFLRVDWPNEDGG